MGLVKLEAGFPVLEYEVNKPSCLAGSLGYFCYIHAEELFYRCDDVLDILHINI